MNSGLTLLTRIASRCCRETYTHFTYPNTLHKSAVLATISINRRTLTETAVKNDSELDNEKLKILKKLKQDTTVDLMNNKIFAIVHMAGSQYKVTNNDVIMLNKRIEAECGDKIRLEKVLAVGGRNFTFVGQPLLKRELVYVEGTVLEKTKGEKVISFKKKKRKGYKRWKGHRQDLSVIKINSIDLDTNHL